MEKAVRLFVSVLIEVLLFVRQKVNKVMTD